ncbi:MAG: excinuclease ABC subunit UvrC [Patescibacteria group bacterium]
MIPSRVRIKNKELPDSPGVYLMKDAKGIIIYVGKATSLKRRVTSYFQKAHDARIEEMVGLIRSIDYIERPTAIEALILEANLIKHYWPKYNVKDKDNRSFLYLVITKEEFPRPLLIRGTELGDDASKKYQAVFGPYTSPRSLRAALDLLRKVFAWTSCTPGMKRPCFYYHLKQCPGVCIGVADKKAYAKTIRDLIRFFEGKKDSIIKQYQREMKKASVAKKFEEAAAWRNKLYFLEHIQDIAILKREDADVDRIKEGESDVNLFGRIEGYDISHISGTSTVASMVVFEHGAPAKAEYRKFRIRSVVGTDDYAALRETITRRFRNSWHRPDLILIDGGIGQVHIVTSTMRELDIGIPVIGMAKGAERKRTDLICDPKNLDLCRLCEKHKTLLIAVRDEAHRFAVAYHRKTRRKKMLEN